MHNTCDAADIAHDKFVRIPGSRDAAQIRGANDSLATLARGLGIDRYRRRAIEVAGLETLAKRPEAMVISESDKALIIEALVAVNQEWVGLGLRARRSFMLSQIEGLTYQQIALELSVR